MSFRDVDEAFCIHLIAGDAYHSYKSVSRTADPSMKTEDSEERELGNAFRIQLWRDGFFSSCKELPWKEFAEGPSNAIARFIPLVVRVP